MRNLSDQCNMCTENNKDLAYCFEVCGVPGDLLEQIENERNKRNEILDIVMKSKSEDLERNLYEWLNKRTEILK